MTFGKYLFLLLTTILLAGCLSPVNTNPPSSYMINTAPKIAANKHSHYATILVSLPETRPIFNTTQMAYSTQPYQVSYFSKNQWAETPSQMLLPLLVQTLQNTHYYHAVVSPPYLGRYNYILNTQILKLQQNFTRHPTQLELIVRAQIISASSNRVIATKQFSASVPINQNTPYAGVIAANRATASVLSDLARFSVQHSG